MSQPLDVSRIGHTVLLSFLIVTVTSVATAQMKKVSRLAAPAVSNTAVQPQLLNADTNPTLRFPIVRFSLTASSISFGWLDIARGGFHYTVAQPPNKLADGFSASTAEIRDLKWEEGSNLITFRTGSKRHTIFYVPHENWGGAHGSSRDFYAATTGGAAGTQSIYKTMLDFEAMLALVKTTAAPPAPVMAAPVVPASPPTPVAPPAPPAIAVSSPPGASPNQTIESNESSLVIRGVTMDSSGIPMVSINGASANIRPQTTQAAEFWSDSLPLKPGNNAIQITASNSAHVETNLAFIVHYIPKAAPVNPKALDKAEIISLLQGAVPASRVAGIVQERGIKFSPAADDLNEILAVGGSDELIQAIQLATPAK